MPQSYTDDLLTYFTDVEDLRDLFKTYLAAPELPKRILVIHGVGGIGKSSLLRMFRLHCKGVGTPVALASGDEAKSVLAILGDWADDLKADGVTLPTFTKTRQHYRALQARAEDKAQESRKKMGDLAGKTAGKIAETAAGAAVGVAIGSAIPVIGPIAGALGGMGAEALVDWLRGQGFAKPDIDLLLDPAKKLTDDFLADIERAARKRRLVVMLDTFEQLSALEDWARDLAQRLHPNVLLVIAGRAMPNWGRAWPGWLAQAHAEALQPMTDDVMRELVRNYYRATRDGEPDPKQVEAIISFARGLPMVVTSAVQLWVEYMVEDFEAIKAEVVADLVDRLKEGVPEEMTPILEAAATVRWFDKGVLRAVTGQTDVNKAYNELRRFPFIRSRADGLALHDAVREIMDEGLCIHDLERHRELHERAAAYFEAQMAKRTGEEAEHLGLERLYHYIRADEELGIQLFQEMAEELTRYRLVNRLRALMNDVNTYPLDRENNRLWREYYSVRLSQLEGRRLSEIKGRYRAIGDNFRAELKLNAYALCDWSTILLRVEREKTGQATQTLERILTLADPLDAKLTSALLELCGAYQRQARWDAALDLLGQAKDHYEKAGDTYGLITVYNLLKRSYLDQGIWKKGLAMQFQGVETLKTLPEQSYLKAELLGSLAIAWTWMGMYTDAVHNLTEAITIARGFEEQIQLAAFLRDLGSARILQGIADESKKCLAESINTSNAIGDVPGMTIARGFLGLLHLRCAQIVEAEEDFTYCLEAFNSWSDPWSESLFLGWRGILYEITRRWDLAENDYHQSLKLSGAERRYRRVGALTGLVRVQYAQEHYAFIPSLISEAEALAKQYEYNDHLASLRLTQGHVAWEDHIAEWGSGFDAALRYYQHALIYALRYNRFLLDEALSGRPQGTPLRPIIPHCRERGAEGQRMLVALRDWWQTSVNDIGAPRPDTISPIPEGIPLLEAERIARDREPGDGSPQKTVTEQIDAALSG